MIYGNRAIFLNISITKCTNVLQRTVYYCACFAYKLSLTTETSRRQYCTEPLYVQLFVRSTSRYLRSCTLNVKVDLGYGKVALFWSSSFLTLLYSSKVNAVLYPRRVSPPLKKTPWYVLRGQCCPSAHPFGCDSTLLKIMVFLARFRFLKSAPNGYFYLPGAVTVTHDQITEQNTVVCRGQEGPKATWRPDFQANTKHRLF